MKRMMAAALCLLMLVCCISACSGKAPASAGSSSVSAGTESKAPEKNAQTVLASFNRADYGGSEFRILCSNAYNSAIYEPQSPLEEQNGEPVNDALYLRDRMLEEYFNVNIKYTVTQYEHDGTNALVLAEARKSILAGDNSWDLIFGSMNLVIVPLINSGLITDFNDVPNINLSGEWWNKNANKDLELEGKMYFATGDITTRYVTSAFVLLFNKNLFNNFGIAYPYDKVYNGNWTIDDFSAIIKGRASDINSDGKNDNDDFWGLVPEGGSRYAFYAASGESMFKTDTAGKPCLACTSDSSYAALDRLITALVNNDVLVEPVTYDSNKIFREGRALFLSCAVCDITLLRDMDNDFGILPIPKVRESQDEYYSHSNPWIATSAAIPKTASGLDKIGLLTEAMAAVSKYTSIPAQYNITMQQKQARDEDSIKMLEIAVNSTKYDLGYLFSWGNYSGIFESVLTKGGEYASQFTANETSALAAIDKTLSAITVKE